MKMIDVFCNSIKVTTKYVTYYLINYIYIYIYIYIYTHIHICIYTSNREDRKVLQSILEKKSGRFWDSIRLNQSSSQCDEFLGTVSDMLRNQSEKIVFIRFISLRFSR